MARKETIRFLLSNFDSDGTAARKSKLGETTLPEGGLGFREEIFPLPEFQIGIDSPKISRMYNEPAAFA
jgi:hypothetical protein